MWPNPQETADLVTFTEDIINEKLHFLWSVFLFGLYRAKLSKTKSSGNIRKKSEFYLMSKEDESFGPMLLSGFMFAL